MTDPTLKALDTQPDPSTPGSIQARPPRRILAIDLGKFKSVVCDDNLQTGEHRFDTIRTRPQDLHDLLTERRPGRLVIEIGSAAGWVADLAEALEIDVQIANPNHEAWRWKNVKRKTDKDDALKLAQLSAMDQLPTLQLPASGVRQWRGRITGQGNKRLRALLVEVGWLMRRSNPLLKSIFDRVCKESKARRKIAVAATARRLLVICWAMLRDGTRWDPPGQSALA